MGPLFLVAVFFALGLFVELLSLLFWGSKLASIALLYDMLASMKVIIQKKKICLHSFARCENLAVFSPQFSHLKRCDIDPFLLFHCLPSYHFLM